MLQAELLQSRSEVKSLLDKISELIREKAENVSHVVHTQLLQIADEKALQAETKCRKLENEVQRPWCVCVHASVYVSLFVCRQWSAVTTIQIK